jgi:hypothetical protein
MISSEGVIQSAQPDDIDLFHCGLFPGFFRSDHHAQVDHLVVVTAKHHAHNVFPMSCTSPFTVASALVLGFRRVSSGLFQLRCTGAGKPLFFHHAGRFDDLGQEHFPEPNRSPTTFMPSISGPSMIVSAGL